MMNRQPLNMDPPDLITWCCPCGNDWCSSSQK